MSRRAVLVHRYFTPDTPPYATILDRVAQRLAADGWQVTVLTCQPSYDGASGPVAAREVRPDAIRVRRMRVLPDRGSSALKLVNTALFCLWLLTRRLGRADVVMAASTPPVAVAATGRALARRCGAAFVSHKQDIYPEVVLATGRLGRPLARLLAWVDGRTDRASDRVVVLSDDMARTVRRRGVPDATIVVLNNFDPWPEPSVPRDRVEDGVRRVVWAGNLGAFQNVELFFDACRMLVAAEPAVQVDVFGGGALLAPLRAQSSRGQMPGVTLHGRRPPGEVAAFLRTHADVGIVSLAPGVVQAAYPSRTMSFLRNGCPVLALVEEDSELARDLARSGAGRAVEPVDARVVADALGAMLADSGSRCRDSARALYEEQFAPGPCLDRWADLFDALAPERAVRSAEVAA